MHRRDLLAGLAATAAAGGLAGCLGTVAEATLESEPDSSDPEDGSGEPDVEIEPPFDADADEPFDRYELADPEGDAERALSHLVFVRNTGDDGHSISIAVGDDGSESAFEETEEVPAGEYIEIRVADPDPVDVVVESDGARAQTVTGNTDGGCSLTIVSLGNGGLQTEARSTSEPCTELGR